MKQDAVIDMKMLIRYADGDVTRLEEEEIAQRLDNNAQATTRLADLQQMMHHLGQVDESLSNIDIVPLVRAAVAAGTRRRPMRQVPAFSAALAACLAAGLAVYFIWPPSQKDEMAESGQFRIKGDDAPGKERKKWTSLSAYITDGTTEPHKLGTQMHLKDALLFAYTNNGAEPFRYLMVFAVDSTGTVYWYYPAYLRAGTDPVAIPIETGTRNAELKELVHHRMVAGPLLLVGLFTDEAIRVSRIEQIIAGLAVDQSFVLDASFEFPINNCAQHVIRTKVIP